MNNIKINTNRDMKLKEVIDSLIIENRGNIILPNRYFHYMDELIPEKVDEFYRYKSSHRYNYQFSFTEENADYYLNVVFNQCISDEVDYAIKYYPTERYIITICQCDKLLSELPEQNELFTYSLFDFDSYEYLIIDKFSTPGYKFETLEDFMESARISRETYEKYTN